MDRFHFFKNLKGTTRMNLLLSLFSLVLALSFVNCNDSSQVIETLDGNKVTVNDFKLAYETALDSISRLQNIEKKTLHEFIEKEPNEVPSQFEELYFQLQKKNFYNTYRQMLMTKIVAQKKGFTTRPDIQETLKQVEMQTISQLYVSEEVEKRLKITDDQVKEECERLRKVDKNIATLTIDRCLSFARAQLKQNLSREILPNIVQGIKEEVTVRRNENFDLDAYLAPKKKAAEPAESEGTPLKSEAVDK